LKVSRNILPCQHRAGLRHRGGENPAVGIGGRLRRRHRLQHLHLGADRDKAAIANFHLRMEFKKSFGLSAVLGAESAAAEDEHHRRGGVIRREGPCAGRAHPLIVSGNRKSLAVILRVWPAGC